jgi:hypothetical protein
MINSSGTPQSPWKSSEMSSETKRAYLTLYSKLPQRSNHLPCRPTRRRETVEDYKIEIPDFMNFSTPTRPVVPNIENQPRAMTTKNSNRTEFIHRLGLKQADVCKSENFGSYTPHTTTMHQSVVQPHNS